MEYESFFQKWLSGLGEEISFWDDYMETKGGAFKEDFEWTVKKNKPFTLESEIENFDSCSFLDVGSGPFSRCGSESSKTKLSVTAVDPLGHIYETLKTRNNLNNGVFVSTGFVELLNHQFQANSFDIVHMSNSLDHSFDPVFGIYQLLRACKIGGKVILRHAENEAENENYRGLHQWNLSLKRKKNELWIWNKNKEINITELFEQYADIACYPDLIEEDGATGHWKYNKVVMIKKQNVEIPQNDYYEKMLKEVYNYLLLQLLEKNDQSEEKKVRRRKQKLLEALGRDVKFEKNGKRIKRCAVYGMSELGRNLFDALLKANIEVYELYDKKTGNYKNREFVNAEKNEKIEDDLIIITPITFFDEVKDLLMKKGVSEKNIISIENIVNVRG